MRSNRTSFRMTAAVVVAVLAWATMTVVSPAAEAQPENLSVSKSAPATVLVGEEFAYSVSASNPAGNDHLYNLSFRDQLPAGVSYVPGSTTPSDAGEPQVITEQVEISPGQFVNRQTLIWPNVSDLPPGAGFEIGFAVAPDPDVHVVASELTNTGQAYASTDPRFVPRFDSAGVFDDSRPGVGGASSGEANTLVTALEIDKAEPSPEGELLRGIHDQTTVYTLTVTINDVNPVDGVTVVDFLPAELEFLGCGGEDNSTDTPAYPDGVEYPGAPPLTATPAPPGCIQPESVTTVQDPTVGQQQLTGVYTMVTWDLGDLDQGDVVELRYAAGIPLRANTMDWPNGEPSAGSGEQGSNLDNNTGPLTRELSSEDAITNHARTEGTYVGPVAPGADNEVFDETELTRTIEDVALVKSVEESQFLQGELVTFELWVRVSEYVNATNIVLTDVLPNGMCPISGDPNENFTAADAPECQGQAGQGPQGAAFAEVIEHPDGSFDVEFTDFETDANGDAFVSFSAAARTDYVGGGPTVAGDAFTNNAQLTAVTHPIQANDVDEGPQDVGDDSQASVGTPAVELAKRIQPRQDPFDQNCEDGPYQGPGTYDPGTAEPFRLGDQVCFELEVNFPALVDTRNAVVTDFLPHGVTYIEDSAEVIVDPCGGDCVDLDVNDDVLTWTLGEELGSFGRYVPPGATFVVRIAGLVDHANVGDQIDVLGNLMKLQIENTEGAVTPYRTEIDMPIAPVPDVQLIKGVAVVDSPGESPDEINPPSEPPANIDGVEVRQGDVVTFRVDVANHPTDNEAELVGLEVWDVLPDGISCDDLSSISAGGTCTDPGDAGHPSFDGNSDLSAISWEFPPWGALDGPISPGESITLTYDVEIPAATSAAVQLTNTAAVPWFAAPTNLGPEADYFPADNIDNTVDPDDYNAGPVSDPSDVFLPGAEIDKAVISTSVTEANNDFLGQAVNGEEVTYEVEVILPARTTVYNGELTEALPSGVELLASSVTYRPDAADPATAPLPGGVVFDPDTGHITWPGAYDTAVTDEAFVVELTVWVEPDTPTGPRTNTATFSSTDADGGSLPDETDQATFTVVAPDPSLVKSNDAPGPLAAGDEVTYTLTVGNDPTTPPLHDAVVVDCLPGELEFIDYGTVDQGTTQPAEPGDGDNGCPTGTTRLAWDLGTVAPGASVALEYSAEILPVAVGAQTYVNTAELTGSSLDDGVNDPDEERVFTRTDDSPVTIISPVLDKSVDPGEATIGEEVTYTVVATIPAQVNYWGASLIDVLPEGIDASSVELSGYDCEVPAGGDPDACAELNDPPVALDPAPGPGGSTFIGWYLGDATSADDPRELTITYTAVVEDMSSPQRPVRGDDLVNVAQVRWYDTAGEQPDDAGDSFDHSSEDDSATVRVVEPLLSIDKAVAVAEGRQPNRPEPGDVFGYTVTVSNSDAADVSEAYNIEVSDDIPTGVVVDPASISHGGQLTGADPTTGGGTISWSLSGPLAPGDDVALTYDASLAPSSELDTAALLNTATVDSYENLPEGGREYDGPSDDEQVTPAFPEIVTDKTAPEGPLAYTGEPFAWSVEVTNIGDGHAYAVGLTDVLPPNWTYVTGSTVITGAADAEPDVSSAGDPPEQTLVWEAVADLAPGQSFTVNFLAEPAPDATSDPGAGSTVPHVNTAVSTGEDATGSQGNSDGPYGEDSDTAEAHIDAADMEVVKSSDGDPVAGEPFTWTISVSNNGPDTAVGPFLVTDVLPEELDFVSAGGDGWSCGTPDSGGEFTCSPTDGSETLPAGEGFADIVVVTGVPADLAEGTELVNVATVEARTYDPDPDNNTDDDDVEVQTEADVWIAKSLVGDFVPGEQVTYTLDVGNNGPSVSVAPITVTDELPDGLTFVEAAGTDWDCDESGGVVTCTYGEDLPVGPAPQITLVADLDSGHFDPVTNEATVDTTTTDPDPDNNTDDDTSTPEPSADLGVEKSRLGELVAGDPITYRITVNNFGPSDDVGPVTITDEVPEHLTWDSALSVEGDWSCDLDGAVVTCELDGTLVAGGQAVVDLTFDTSPSIAGEQVLNTVEVSSPTPDPNPSNDDDTDDSTVDGEADLWVEKSHEGPVLAGETVTFTIQVGNLGPSDAEAPVTLTDVLPEGMTAVALSGAGWDCDLASVSCELDGLAAGTEAPEVTLTAEVDPSAGPGTLVNISSVDSPTSDPDPSNNTDDDPVEVQAAADLSLTKTVTGDDPVIAGEATQFTLSVANAGPSTAREVVVSDTLPAGFVEPVAAGDGWDCQTSGLTVTCERDELLPGPAPDIVITAGVDSSVPDGTVLLNVAEVDSVTDDPDPSNNTDEDDVLVIAEADLGVVKTHTGEEPVPAGTETTFSIEVTNHGPSDAVGPITVTDVLPEGFVFVSASGPWSCEADEEVFCSVDQDLPAGAQAPLLEMRVAVEPSVDEGDHINVASVSSQTEDPNPSNDTDTDTVPVTRIVDLAVTKSHAGPVRVGENLVFELSVTNRGPSTAEDVVLGDTLPEGLDYAGFDSPGERQWSCEANAGVVCLLDGNLDPGETALLELEVTVAAGAYPSAQNVAEVTSSTYEDPSTLDDNVATDEVTVPPLVDLWVEKSHEGDLTVGETATFLITVGNDGPTPDPGPVTVTDELPEGLVATGASGEGWSCEVSAALVTCELAEGLDVGATAHLEVTVEVGEAALGGVTNVARVSSAAEDIDSSNNVASDEARVNPAEEGSSWSAADGATAAAGSGLLPFTGNAWWLWWLTIIALLLVALGLTLRYVVQTRR